jgi:hypothetical protein
MNLVLTGTLTEVLDTKVLKADFQKRVFAIEISDGNFPTTVAFELTKDKVGLIDKFKVGSEITVGYNVRSNRYVKPDSGEVTYFTSLNAWKISGVENEGQAAPQSSEPIVNPVSTPPPAAAAVDDLPF